MDERGDGTDHSDAMGLTELVKAAGVSVRTVRYYIAEGLLPPPVGAGPRAAYTAEHLDRLRLIARLKDAYLPLREIRRRLRGLDGVAVRALLAEDPSPEAAAPPGVDRPERSPRRSHLHAEDSAAAYLSRLLPPRHQNRAAPVEKRAAAPEVPDERSASDPAGPGDPEISVGLTRADLDRGAALAALDALAEPEEAGLGDPWHRLPIGDDAELLIRAAAYDRQREQVDALVAWARRVLG